MDYFNMIKRSEFDEWLIQSGYCTMNDWNYQTIDSFDYYFIKNHTTNRYALIKRHFGQDRYEVILENWIDYNNWGD